MRILSLMLLIPVLTSNVVYSQQAEKASGQPRNLGELGRPHIVQLTEFRLKSPDSINLSTSEIVKALEEEREKVEIVETIRLTVMPEVATTIQIGKEVAVTTGYGFSPANRAPVKSMTIETIGTAAEMTLFPLEEAVLLELKYESTRQAAMENEESRPDKTTFMLSSTLLLEPGKTTLAGGSSKDGSTYLAVTVK